MLRNLALASWSIALLTTAGVAQALDYGSVGAPSAILYDAPSPKAKKLFVISRYAPLERVVILNDWIKVRDQSGAMAWIEKGALSNKRYVVVTAQLADVRKAPDASSPLLFQARQQVALEWLEDTRVGWVRVRHQDGATGYARVADVWGD